MCAKCRSPQMWGVGASCYPAIMSANPCPDDVPVPTFGHRMVPQHHRRRRAAELAGVVAPYASPAGIGSPDPVREIADAAAEVHRRSFGRGDVAGGGVETILLLCALHCGVGLMSGSCALVAALLLLVVAAGFASVGFVGCEVVRLLGSVI
jgi:hypothetical protein